MESRNFTQRDTHQSLATLLEKLIKIGAKVLHHSPQVIFQLAEVAVREICSRPYTGQLRA